MGYQCLLVEPGRLSIYPVQILATGHWVVVIGVVCVGLAEQVSKPEAIGITQCGIGHTIRGQGRLILTNIYHLAQYWLPRLG